MLTGIYKKVYDELKRRLTPVEDMIGIVLSYGEADDIVTVGTFIGEGLDIIDNNLVYKFKKVSDDNSSKEEIYIPLYDLADFLRFTELGSENKVEEYDNDKEKLLKAINGILETLVDENGNGDYTATTKTLTDLNATYLRDGKEAATNYSVAPIMSRYKVKTLVKKYHTYVDSEEEVKTNTKKR